MNGIFQVEDDGIRPMQRCIDKIFRFRTGQVKPGTPQSVTGRGTRQSNFLQCGACTLARFHHASALRCCLQTRSNYKRQRAFIMDGNMCILNAEHPQHLACLRQNRIAVIRRHSRLQQDLQSA